MNKLSQARTSVAMRTAPLAALCLAALLVGGCATSYTITPEMQARAASENPAPPKDEDFPAPGSATWQQGAFPNLEALRTMRTGMGKDQVRELLGFPHFSEGLAGVREWNYIFHFRTGAGPEYITCQYMVRFNADVLVNGTYWKGPGCADLLKPAPAAARPVAVIQPAPAPARTTTLGADGLFRFDGRSLADLLPDGRRKLDALASDIKARPSPVGAVRVTGHTDRLGSESYNQALSLARATTVRDYLVQAGVPAQSVQVQGRGESEPKVQCAQASRAALIDCLAPNRRVEIEVSTGR
ncbi:outer membrane protein OmpA-like peptidoglycan-associated protein [Variovorax boronicumulans]|uniref:Outer membrane protein OmpA-like peptidoglycan-associated protein n=1 Tax=Variovorax boronicumulans TaxID=436515 RepID=A0AAW8CZJ7_9BURK|nr:OmpA family protein [Variovorax boronicumulans]MDP9894317.1 outer membrane protein OmpA-like peptidoglycan-associated protein [Variovorax boronicumulans]MDQ0054136.1 outer membrane protein OmpA-like peptidoglycan-associated protein [Variovorax boronicumulans]